MSGEAVGILDAPAHHPGHDLSLIHIASVRSCHGIVKARLVAMTAVVFNTLADTYAIDAERLLPEVCLK